MTALPDRLNMPTSLLWLSNELYWKQNLSVPAKPLAAAEAPRPFRTVPALSKKAL